MTPTQQLAQRFGMQAVTDLAYRCPDPARRDELAAACLLWDTQPGESWSTGPLIPMKYVDTTVNND